MYYRRRRRREDEIRYLVGRNVDWILAPHQCEKCWFVNLCVRFPGSGSLADSQTLEVLRRGNLDIFWSRSTSTINGMLGYAKEMIIRSREAGKAVPLPAITYWPMGDEVRMGVVIQVLEKSLSNGRNGRNYLQFNTFRHLQAVALDIYSSIASAHSSRYSLNYCCGSFLHMYEGTIQSSLMERFDWGTKKRMPEDSGRNKPLKYLVINYTLNDIVHEWVVSDTDQKRKRYLLMTASYTCVIYGYSVRGYEGFWVDLQWLVDGIHLVKHDRRETPVLVAVVVRFKG